MLSSVSVNPKSVTKEYSYLIKLRLREDCFPINAQMTECEMEKKRKDQLRLICRLICLVTQTWQCLQE